ncbi:alpha/beta fold hydrolase [Mycolicibacterium fluoranthenivorans]|jgi:proline iminopeptidase|uniref:Proline iminopeptidase n=1 Tax=Mycolicibacterium fluoranthenivorans TaxID=258505 RepID=A0A1G4VAG8_9MYCO|nr:alpha/beta hydrolase [Mycolicibacterium fluoranthenivorans]SCX03739.1 proline iminopeptidase [Mycolicibacterium fluoranthenivorans]
MKAVSVRSRDEVALHVGVVGDGPDVVMLSGGPGCVNYLADEELAPRGVRAWYPEPRGVGRSEGGPHDLAQAIDDLEAIRAALDIKSWIALGHSFGSDLAVRYALDHPESVSAVIGIAGHGLHKDRIWSAVYEAARHTEDEFAIEWNPAVHRSLNDSFGEWIHEPTLFRRLADTEVPMTFVAAADDIRPDWPLRQLAALVPRGRFLQQADVPHNFWSTHPSQWVRSVSALCGDELTQLQVLPRDLT